MIKTITDENQVIRRFLRINFKLSFFDEPIYNSREELIDINKTLKEYGFYNNDRITIPNFVRGRAFTDNKFFDKIILSDLIKEKNDDFFQMHSPSRSECVKIGRNELLSFDIIGSNDGPVFGGKHGRYSLDSNIAKAAVFEGKVKIGEKAIVSLHIVKNNNYFEGDTRNGIKTSDFRYISDLCFIFTNEVLSEDFYHPKLKLIKI